LFIANPQFENNLWLHGLSLDSVGENVNGKRANGILGKYIEGTMAKVLRGTEKYAIILETTFVNRNHTGVDV
jgi:hypothetical protein